MRPVLLRIPMEQVGAAIARQRLPLLNKRSTKAPLVYRGVARRSRDGGIVRSSKVFIGSTI